MVCIICLNFATFSTVQKRKFEIDLSWGRYMPRFRFSKSFHMNEFHKATAKRKRATAKPARPRSRKKWQIKTQARRSGIIRSILRLNFNILRARANFSAWKFGEGFFEVSSAPQLRHLDVSRPIVVGGHRRFLASHVCVRELWRLLTN